MEVANNQKHYLAGLTYESLEWEDTDLAAIMQTQLIYPGDFEKEVIEEILELEFEGTKLVAARDHFQDEVYEAQLGDRSSEILLPKDIKPHRYYYLEFKDAESGRFQLFGKPSAAFQIPEEKANYTVHYYGAISRNTVNWLPFEEIELFAPEFLLGTLYIDYSIPQQPVYLNESVIQKANYPDKGKGFSIKYFKEEWLSLTRDSRVWNVIGTMGLPIWIQHPEIPRCPRTGKVMKFLLNLDSYKHNCEEGKYNYTPGVYFFMEPESKVVAVVLQTS